MAKKALVSSIETAGNPANPGQRVLEVVNPGEEFEVHSDLQWLDCGDTVESYVYWYKDGAFKKLPEAVDPIQTAGELTLDENGMSSEEHIWDWDTETWSKQAL